MAIRWIRNDGQERIHCAALLSQELPVPAALMKAVTDTGGSIYTARSRDSFIQKASWLRRLAYDLANCIILHIDVDDVICGVAFGIDGGPPVLLVNHSAHIFWTGASIADLVLNCRGSALEGIWATAYRGIARYATVPIPLLGAGFHPSTQAQAIVKREAKKRIGIPEDSIVILTVGASFKYLPLDGLDFVGVCESVLKELPGAFYWQWVLTTILGGEQHPLDRDQG